jgi:hypothetical protein
LMKYEPKYVKSLIQEVKSFFENWFNDDLFEWIFIVLYNVIMKT